MPRNTKPRSHLDFSILIHTDSYAGNFSRELRGYVTGSSDPASDSHGDSICAEIREHFTGDPDADWEECDENPFLDLFKYVRGDYGPRIEALAYTPAPFGKGECNSIRLFCTRRPTETQLGLVKEWTLKFAQKCSIPRTIEDHDNRNPFCYLRPIRVLGFSLVWDEVKTVHNELPF